MFREATLFIALSSCLPLTVPLRDGDGGMAVEHVRSPWLSALSLSEGRVSPDFSSQVTSYTVGVRRSLGAITVTPTAASETATIEVQGTRVVSGTASPALVLSEGSGSVAIKVTDGLEAATYTLEVTPLRPTETALIDRTATGAPDKLGSAVAMSQQTIALGAPGETTSTGAVYVYGRVAGEWAQQQYLKAPNANLRDAFGTSVAMDADVLVVGAPNEDSAATGVNGDQLSNESQQSGAAYVFRRDGTGWAFEAYLKASDTSPSALFGDRVAISGETIAISARGTDGNRGAAYVFARAQGHWVQQARLSSPRPRQWDFYGAGLALAGDTLAVGSPGDYGPDGHLSSSGAVFVYARSESTWSPQAELRASNAQRYDQFGQSLALLDHTLAVGALIGGPINHKAGAVYVFSRSGAHWTQQAMLKPDVEHDGDAFGSSVALGRNTLVAGAWYDDSSATGVDGPHDELLLDSGAAYVFMLNGSTWSQRAYLKPSKSQAEAYFGASVAVDGDAAIVGAHGLACIFTNL